MGSFEVYEDSRGMYRWRVLDRRGEPCGGSVGGWPDREDCERNAVQVGMAIVNALARDRM
jgi:hypothetical protein